MLRVDARAQPEGAWRRREAARDDADQPHGRAGLRPALDDARRQVRPRLDARQPRRLGHAARRRRSTASRSPTSTSVPTARSPSTAARTAAWRRAAPTFRPRRRASAATTSTTRRSSGPTTPRELYEESVARQWSSARDIPWDRSSSRCPTTSSARSASSAPSSPRSSSSPATCRRSGSGASTTTSTR